VIGARRLERLEELADQIRGSGGEAHPVRLDLGDASSVEMFAKAAIEAVGEVDVLVSAAGASVPDSVVASSPDDFASTVEVNLIGAQRLVGLLAPSMVARGRGDIVFVTSEVVRLPRVRTKGYVASKWGLEGYARALQMELEGTGVRASIVQPGQTFSEMGRDWDPQVTGEVLGEWIRWGLARHGHFLHPDEVAQVVRAVVEAPAGVHLAMVEVQPLAPLATAARHEDPTDAGNTNRTLEGP
jgi:NADP-dependent 3-hydroxy acid dehydrogenase YdfG